MTTFFTADLHMGHARVIEYCRRPFANVDEMNEALIRNWNGRVGKSDEVFVLGDFALCRADEAIRFAGRLNGNKFLVAGNHDKANLPKYVAAKTFQWVKDLTSIERHGQHAVLCHFAMLTWNRSHHGAWMLHGHSHGSLKDDARVLRMDVGVDCCGYAPISLEEVASKMAAKAWKPIDHHGEEP